MAEKEEGMQTSRLNRELLRSGSILAVVVVILNLFTGFAKDVLGSRSTASSQAAVPAELITIMRDQTALMNRLALLIEQDKALGEKAASMIEADKALAEQTTRDLKRACDVIDKLADKKR